MGFPLTSLLSIGEKILDRVIPDKQKALEAKMELAKLDQAGELAQLAADTDLAKGQIEINKIEAASANWWVAGWRPAIGWVGAASLFTYYVPYCLVATVVWAHQVWATQSLVPRPDLGISDLIGLIASMLGVAGMRTFEKVKGVTK